MAKFQGRSGPEIHTLTRKVDNFVYDSVDEIIIEYKNYYYSSDKNTTPHFFEQFKEGQKFYAIASTLRYNHLVLDDVTQNDYYPNGTSGSSDILRNNFQVSMGRATGAVDEYISYFDELTPQKFTSTINTQEPYSKFVILTDSDRTTATLPIEHLTNTSKSADAIHFSLGTTGITSNATNDILTVIVYRSNDNLDDALGNLKKFHSKKSSTKVAEIKFEEPLLEKWNPVSINLRDLDIPNEKCLLWFEFIRFPYYPKNPFPAAYAAWDDTLIDSTWYNFSHTRTTSYPDIDSTGWVINPDNRSMEANINPEQKMIGRVSGEEHEDYIFETVVKSTSAQNGAMGVVIGFVFENGYEYTLSAFRSQGGPMESKTWFAVANAGQSVSFFGLNYENPNIHYELWDNSSSLGLATNSWADPDSPPPVFTKIRVEKSADQVKLYTSPLNSNVIDLSTEIIIPLTGENERFKRSKIGFASWGQPLAQWHDVHFEIGGDWTDPMLNNGTVGVSGLGIENSSREQFFSNPKQNSVFIEEYFSEAFVDKIKVAKQSFNSFTGLVSESLIGSNIIIDNKIDYEEMSIAKLLLHRPGEFEVGGTIGDWSIDKSFIETSSSFLFEFNPFSPFSIHDNDISTNWNGLYLNNPLIVGQEQSVTFQGITYQFEKNDKFVGGIDRYKNDIIQAEYVSIFSKTHDSFVGKELVASQTAPEHLVLEYETGLFVVDHVDLQPINRQFMYGPPTKTLTNTSLSFIDPKDTFQKESQFFEILKSNKVLDKKFFEITNDISLPDVTWKETVKIIEFDFPKTAFFEYAKDLELPIKVFYTPVLDKPFVHKVFFVNLDIPNLDFKPFIEDPKTNFLIEQNYLHTTISVAKGPKNKFKHLMIEELYRPGFKDRDQVYEFMMDKFESVSSTPFDYNKFGYTFYEPITTNRPSLSGGSNAFGHDLLPVMKQQEVMSHYKFFDLGYEVENSFGIAGRHGRSRDHEYRETQFIEAYEFTNIDWHIETGGTFDPNWIDNSANSSFNFVFTRDDSPENGRIPDCLIFDDNRITGTFTDTDKFLRQYQWESWTTLQGTTKSSNNNSVMVLSENSTYVPTEAGDEFTSISDTLDFDYDDFSVITPRLWEVNFTGTSITKGTIDLVYEGTTLNRGDIITQNISGEINQLEIIEKISEFNKDSDRAGGSLVSELIHRYEFENLRGNIEVTTLEETFSETFVSGNSSLEEEKTAMQDELLFSTGMRKSILQKKIAELIETISENTALNPTGFGFIVKVPAGKQVNYQRVTNADGELFVVDDFGLNGSGAVKKFIKIVFKIHNNWSFDRDLRLFTNTSIVDSDYSNRTDWVEAERAAGRGLFNPSNNNIQMDIILEEYIKDYDIGVITIDDYITKRDFVIDSRDYFSEDQKIEYKQFLDTIIYKNLKTGQWEKDINVINTLTGNLISEKFRLSDSKDRGERFDTISQTENGEQVFKLNCSTNVDEQTFYDNIDPVRVIRGYPVYASCN